MDYDRPPTFIPATPEYVLEVFRDGYRHFCGLHEDSEPGGELSFDTTVAQWRLACSEFGFRSRDHARSLERLWKLGRTDEEWLVVLEPAKERTLVELCEFIARDALMPTIEPVCIMGSTCRKAGAFLAIRSVLSDAGVDVSSLAPSTPLARFFPRHLLVFLGPISRLAPNALPDITFFRPRHRVGLVRRILGVVFAIAGWLIAPLAIVDGTVLAFVSWTASWFIAQVFVPSRLILGDLRTFRDLAEVVAEGAS